jgi:hypothetical protein
MPNALVHIGLHKTGSTYVQMICYSSREELRAAGIHFIGSGFKETVRQTRKLVEQRKTTEELALWEPTALRRALAQAPPDEHLFLSCESLEALGRWPRSLADLHGMLKERYERVTYFVVVRNVIDHAASEMQQNIKMFGAKDLYIRTKHLEGRPMQNRLRTFFEGDYALAITDFDTFVNGDTHTLLARLMSEKLGSEPPALRARPASNESIGAMGVAFMLAMTNLTREALGTRVPRLPDWDHFKSVQVHTRRAIRNELDTDARFMPFTEDEQGALISRTREASAPFIERFPGAWAEAVFSLRPRAYNVVLLSALEPTERARIEALILETWNRIERVLRKDFDIREGYDAGEALVRYLAREPEIMLRSQPLSKKIASERAPEDAKKESRRERRRKKRQARRAAAQAGLPMDAAAPRWRAQRRRNPDRDAVPPLPPRSPTRRDRWPLPLLRALSARLGRVFGMRAAGKPTTVQPANAPGRRSRARRNR